MKPKYSRFISQPNSPSIANPRIVVTGLACLATFAIHFASSAHAADGSWNVDANGLWSGAGNWSGGTVADGSGSTANFTNDITADRAVSLDGVRTLSGFVFSDSDTATAGSWLIDNNGNAANNFILAGTPTVAVNALGTGKSAAISALIDDGASNLQLTKSGAGTLVLSNAANTFDALRINAGTVRVASNDLQNVSTASAIGNGNSAAGDLILDGGTLALTGSLAADKTITRGFTVGANGAIIDMSGTTAGRTVWFQTTLANTGSGARALSVTGGSTTLRLGTIANGSGGATSVVKTGTGTLLLTGTNTYTGLLDIQAGTVQLGNAGLGGESTGVGHSVAIASVATLAFRHASIDAVTYNAPISGDGKLNATYNNSGAGGGSLTLGGNNSFTGGLTINPTGGNNIIPLKAATTAAFGTGNVTIGQYGKLDLNGFSNTTGLLISTGANGLVTNDGAAPATLTLNGTTTQTFGGVIADGTGVVSIVKSGLGSQTFTGLNTYSGSTTIFAGTLSISTDDTLSDTGAVNLTTGAVLNLNHAGTDTVGALVIDGAGAAAGTWGRVGSIAEFSANFESPLITGDGLIDNLNLSNLLPYYWDATGTSWSSAASWTADPANPATDPTTPPTATSVPIFGANGVGDDTVELGGNQTAGGLSLINPAVFTFTGGGVSSDLSLGAAGITLDADVAGVVIGSVVANQDVDVVLTANQAWINGNAAANVSALNAVSAGSNALTLAGAGTFTLGGPITGTGTLTLAGAGASNFGSSVNDFTTIAVTGSGPATFSGAVTGLTNINKRGIAGLDLAGTNTHSGGITLDQGALTISGNSSGATGSILLRGAGANGTLFLQVATTATFASTSSVSVAGGNSIQVGANNFDGSAGQTLNANGTLINNGSLLIGRSATVNVGGAWTQNGSARLQTLGGFAPTLKVNTGGAFTYASSSDFLVGSSSNSVANTTLNLDGGTLVTGARIHNDQVTVFAGASSRISLSNGGTLRLSATLADLFTTAGGTRSFLLGTGGGVVDTNGSSTTLNVPVSGTGGLTKSGGGALTLAELNTYSGDTTVSAGTLSLGQVNISNESSTVSIASGAFLNLGFGGIDTVDKLFIDGVQQNAGDYTSAHASGRFTGGGTLRVSSNPVAAGFASWIDDFGLALADQDPSDDPDNDGMDNLLEFVLNGNPSISDSSILPDLVVTATDFEFTYQRRDDSVAPETTQTFQWGTTLATWPGSVVVTAGGGSFPPATVTVTPGVPSDAVTDTVKITIPKSQAGGSGTLFGRLQVVKP